MIFSVANLG